MKEYLPPLLQRAPLDVAQERRNVVVHGAEVGVAADVRHLASGGDLSAAVAAPGVTVIKA